MPTRPSPRERLIDTAADLFYERGLPNVGINEVTDRAGVARMTLYNNFDSKEALALAAFQRQVEIRRAVIEKRLARARTYFDFSEPLAKLPSHRILALYRGEKEAVLTLELVPDPAAPDRGEPSAFEQQIANRFKIADRDRPGDRWLIDTVRLAWRTRVLVHIESDLRLRL
jgi:AcrR family transcriptional regulator